MAWVLLPCGSCPERLEAVQTAVGHRRQAGTLEDFRGPAGRRCMVRKRQLTIGESDATVEPLIQATLGAAWTGDGEVGVFRSFVLPPEACVRIRTAEQGGSEIRDACEPLKVSVRPSASSAAAP